MSLQTPQPSKEVLLPHAPTTSSEKCHGDSCQSVFATHLHADIEIAHLVVHVLVLLQVLEGAPHVPEPQQQVQNQHRPHTDDHNQGDCLQMAVLGCKGTIWIGGDSPAPDRSHLIICSKREPSCDLVGSAH